MTLLLNISSNKRLCGPESRLQLVFLPLRIARIKYPSLLPLSSREEKLLVCLHCAWFSKFRIRIAVHQSYSFTGLLCQSTQGCASAFVNVEEMDCLGKGQVADWSMHWQWLHHTFTPYPRQWLASFRPAQMSLWYRRRQRVRRQRDPSAWLKQPSRRVTQTQPVVRKSSLFIMQVFTLTRLKCRKQP